MNSTELLHIIKEKKSFLCVGLDADINKIPKHLLNEDDPIFAFNKQIIDATIDLTVAYKPNLAFYESLGVKGLISLQKTMDYLDQFRNQIFTIADAKRGDIGNTSKQYATTFFDKEKSGFSFDSVTVAPYMGSDSVMPFLEFENKWVILLALTSNKGAFDFQLIKDSETDTELYKHVLEISKQWGTEDNMMYVVGATKAEMLGEIRKIIPHHFLLVPGVGAQGGSLDEVVKYGMNDKCGLLVNSSRGIIFADSGEGFAAAAREEAKKLQLQMQDLLIKNHIIA